jgi:hypothetical protein
MRSWSFDPIDNSIQKRLSRRTHPVADSTLPGLVDKPAKYTAITQPFPSRGRGPRFLAKPVTQRHLTEIHNPQQILARRMPAPPAADNTLLASTNGCYGIRSAVKCARDSWQRLPGSKQSERQNKAEKPAPNPVLRRETVLELAEIVREARSRQSRKVCVA